MQPQKARPRLESEIISADAQSLPKFIRLQPKSVDQIRKRGLLLPPAWVIQEKAWERLTPILQHADKFPALKLRHHPFVRHEGYAGEREPPSPRHQRSEVEHRGVHALDNVLIMGSIPRAGGSAGSRRTIVTLAGPTSMRSTTARMISRLVAQ